MGWGYSLNKRVLIYLRSAIGETLFALPLIRGLAENNYEVVLVGRDRIETFYSFLKTEGVINDFRLYGTPSLGRLRQIIRDLHLDILILPPKNDFEPFYLKFLRATSFLRPIYKIIFKHILNLNDYTYISVINIPSKSTKEPLVFNATLSNTKKLDEFNIPFKEDYLYFNPSLIEKGRQNSKKKLDDYSLKENGYAVIYGFSTTTEKYGIKNLPPDLFVKVVRVCNRLGLKVVLIGTKKDSEEFNQYLDDLSQREKKNITNACGTLDFVEMIGLLNLSKYVFSIDGGMLHFSLASKAKTISFWGPTISESLVFPNHKFNYPMCKYLPFQPYSLIGYNENYQRQVFDFSEEEILNRINEIEQKGD